VELINEVIQTPGLLKEIYGDLAKPGVSQVGKALSTVVGLGNTILWPVALLNERQKYLWKIISISTVKDLKIFQKKTLSKFPQR